MICKGLHDDFCGIVDLCKKDWTQVSVPLLYLLEISRNRRFSVVIKGHRNV